MADALVVARNLTRRFGDFTAVDHVSFEVYPGEVVGYLGPNGSGKTTTIRMLLGLLEPTEGDAWVLGYSVRTHAWAIRERVGYMSQRFALYDELTVGENLTFYGQVYGAPRRRARELAERLGLTARWGQRVGTLPAGWRQRVALAAAILHQPRMIFLDEPTSGVDPAVRRQFWDLIYDLLAQGMTAFVTTHYMDEAEFCHRVGIMHRGRLLAMDTPQALKARALAGPVWVLHATPLLTALRVVRELEGVQQAGLYRDRIRALVVGPWDEARWQQALASRGVQLHRAQPDEPTLEDVFLALAGTSWPSPSNPPAQANRM